MTYGRFEPPLLIVFPQGEPVAVQTPREAVAAMAQHGVGDYDMKNSAWAEAFTLAVRATLDASPENLHAARTALEALSNAGLNRLAL